MDVFSQNIIIVLLFFFSGLIIQSALKKRGMRVARILFLVLFGILLVYVPFYFGGNLMVRCFDTFLPEAELTECFGILMGNLLNMPFIFMQSVSLVTAVLAVFVLAATVIAAVAVVQRAFRFAAAQKVEPCGVSDDGFTGFLRQSPVRAGRRGIYILFQRLLN